MVALWDVSSNATISIGAIIKAAAAPKMIIQKKIRAKNNLNREPRILNILAFSFTKNKPPAKATGGLIPNHFREVVLLLEGNFLITFAGIFELVTFSSKNLAANLKGLMTSPDSNKTSCLDAFRGIFHLCCTVPFLLSFRMVIISGCALTYLICGSNSFRAKAIIDC